MVNLEDISKQHMQTSVETCREAQLRRLNVLQQHLSVESPPRHKVYMYPCRAPASTSHTKVSKASDAVALIPDSAVITVRRLGHSALHMHVTHDIFEHRPLHSMRRKCMRISQMVVKTPLFRDPMSLAQVSAVLHVAAYRRLQDLLAWAFQSI